MNVIWGFLTWILVVLQMPAELPPEGSEGWPQPAFKLAIVTERVGFTQRAEGMANELWESRDPATGLWVNWLGTVDTVNPLFAVMLYSELGQDERALQVYRDHVSFARCCETHYSYNYYWWPVISALIVEEPIPLDLFARSSPGVGGRYAKNDSTPHSLFYSNVMLSYWREYGGPGFVPYEQDWCHRKECEINTKWAKGESFLPIMPGPYNFYTDDVLFLATWRGKEARP